MKLKPSSYFLIFLILFAVVFLVYTFTFGPYQSKIVGLMASSVVIVLGIIQFAKECIEARNAEPTKEEEKRYFLRRSGLLTIWVGGFIIITYLFGFLVSSPLFVIAYLRAQGTRWISAVITGAATTVLIFTLFEWFLVRKLWRGLIPFF